MLTGLTRTVGVGETTVGVDVEVDWESTSETKSAPTEDEIVHEESLSIWPIGVWLSRMEGVTPGGCVEKISKICWKEETIAVVEDTEFSSPNNLEKGKANS